MNRKLTALPEEQNATAPGGGEPNELVGFPIDRQTSVPDVLVGAPLVRARFGLHHQHRLPVQQRIATQGIAVGLLRPRREVGRLIGEGLGG